MFTSFLNIELGHTEEQQLEMLGETSISSLLDSWWLLYTQPIISEGKTAHMEIRATLDAVIMEEDGAYMNECHGQQIYMPFRRSEWKSLSGLINQFYKSDDRSVHFVTDYLKSSATLRKGSA